MLRWLVVGAMLVGASPARAALGNGIRVGGSEGRLHPFIELELRYDTNVASFYDPTLGATKAGDLILHARPGLQLNVPGESVSLDLRASLDYARYFGLKETKSTDLSALYANVDLGVGINRRGQIGLELDEKFVRSNTPSVYSIATGIVSNYNNLAVSLPWRPGGGALTVSLGGDWALESFDTFKSGLVCGASTANPFCDSQYVSDLGYSNYGANLGLNWKFLPKTAALLDVAWFDRVPNSTLRSVAGTGLRAQAGVSGLVTSQLAATLKAGYGSTLNLSLDPAAVPQADIARYGTWLALVSVEWIPTMASSLKLTWNHDFGFDPGTTWSLYTANHVTLDGKVKLNRLLGLALTADLTTLAYRNVGANTSTIVTARPGVQAELSRWALLELAYQYTDRTTDAATPPPGWKYSRSEVWLRGVFTY